MNGDLSHWDLADEFSADEITDLMLGREPCHNMAAPQIVNSPVYKIINKRTQEALSDLLYHANHFYAVEVIDKSKLSAFVRQDSLALHLKLFNESDAFKVVRQQAYMDNLYIKQQLDDMCERFEKTEKFIFSKQILRIWNSLRNTINIEECFSAEWVQLNSFSINKDEVNKNVYVVDDDEFRGLVGYYEFRGGVF